MHALFTFLIIMLCLATLVMCIKSVFSDSDKVTRAETVAKCVAALTVFTASVIAIKYAETILAMPLISTLYIPLFNKKSLLADLHKLYDWLFAKPYENMYNVRTTAEQVIVSIKDKDICIHDLHGNQLYRKYTLLAGKDRIIGTMHPKDYDEKTITR